MDDESVGTRLRKEAYSLEYKEGWQFKTNCKRDERVVNGQIDWLRSEGYQVMVHFRAFWEFYPLEDKEMVALLVRKNGKI